MKPHPYGGEPEAAPDVDLLRRCAAGHAIAMRVLFDRYHGPLTAYLYRLLGNREDAEELVADVFVRAWRGAAGFKGEASARTWLYRIALHVAIDRLRSLRRLKVTCVPFADLEEQRVTAAAAGPEERFLEACQREQERTALRCALGRLAPRDRALLALRYLEDCSYEQIRGLTGTSLAVVKSQLHRARQRLKRHFLADREADEAEDGQDESTEDPTWEVGHFPEAQEPG